MAATTALLPDVEPLCRILAHDWVWHFFFESDRHHADMFTLAVEDRFSMLFDLSIRTEHTSDPHANAFAVRERHRALFLPTFSNGPVTVGFGVCDRITSSLTLACRQRYIGKVARDDSRAVVYFLAVDPAIDLLEITTYSMFSATTRAHAFSIFRMQQFMNAVQCIRNGPFCNPRVAAALVYYYEAFETCPCVVCHAADPTLCCCQLPFSTKKHPRDTVTDINNMKLYMGTFSGVAKLTLCSNGAVVFSSSYESHSFINFHNDPQIKRELIEWAMTHIVQERRQDPLTLVMAEAATLKSRFVTATDTFMLASIAESILSKPVRFDHTPPPQHQPLPLSLPMSDASMDAFVNTLEPSTGISAGFGTAVTHLNALSQDPELQQLLSQQQSFNSTNMLSDCSESISLDALWQTTPPPPLDSPGVHAQTGLDSAICSQNANQVVPSATRRLSVLAPAPCVQSAIPGAEQTKTHMDEERRRRIELRKARNRESAQRSNLRKKMQLQQLKDELEAAAAKEACLRAREKTLRKENMRLRTAVMR
ncbi:unnamed protein product [Agarophyton chilense]